MATLEIIFWGVLTFSIIVVLHEAGHFLAARAFRVKVHEFMIGLPGPAIRLRTKKMAWGVTAVPLGGYVRIAGMEPGTEDPLLGQALGEVVDRGRTDTLTLAGALGVDRDKAAALLATLADYGAIEPAEDDEISYLPAMERRPGEDDPALLARARAVTFRGLSTWRRITVLSAGVLTNLVVAMLAFTIVLTLWGAETATMQLETVETGTPAASAGLRPGDTLIALDGTDIETWDAFRAAIDSHEPGDVVTVTYERGGVSSQAVAELAEKDGGAYLGVGVVIETVQLSLLESARMSFGLMGQAFRAVFDLFNPVTFGKTVGGVYGVVGIAIESAGWAKAGPMYYAFWIALLSLSLGAVNLAPIPPLDGGKVVLEIVERLRGRPLSRRFTLGVSAAGALFLFSLIGYLVYADIVRFGLVG